jgi:hypothetical protein
VAFARSESVKSAVVSDCLMMTGNFAGLGVAPLETAQLAWIDAEILTRIRLRTCFGANEIHATAGTTEGRHRLLSRSLA